MSTLSNATDVLRLLARLQRDVSVSDVTNALGWPKSSASRTLSKMAEAGFLERNPETRAYRPGKVILEASYYLRGASNTQSLLEGELDRLAAETGYASYVNLLDGAESLVVQMRVGRAGPLQVYYPVGTRGPAYASSMGRSMLARLGDAELLARTDTDFSAEHGAAPRSEAELLRRIGITRDQGWALSQAEFIPDVTGISAAVVETDSQQIYGIGIALPGTGHSDEVMARFGLRVRDAARSVGRQIGDAYWLDARFGGG
ncbi:MAG: IclR family transcriptional regulator [Tropicimonas sp.]|uniref:IclR family transcriptional regulator n=1 Tax=Tropicimonas sp. TaxID=2067044 RepID=UPI003A83D94A